MINILNNNNNNGLMQQLLYYYVSFCCCMSKIILLSNLEFEVVNLINSIFQSRCENHSKKY